MVPGETARVPCAQAERTSMAEGTTAMGRTRMHGMVLLGYSVDGRRADNEPASFKAASAPGAAYGVSRAIAASCAFGCVARACEVVRQLDRVGDAQHHRDLGLIETRILERERRRRRTRNVLALGARGHVPHRRTRD